MKTAILLPGYLRFYKECHQNFTENILKPFQEQGEVDIFVHTWKNIIPEHFGAGLRGWLIKPLPEVNIDEFCQLYQPQKIEIEDFQETKSKLQLKNFCDLNMAVDELNSWQEWWDGVLHTTCQHYKIYKTNELKKRHEEQNNFKYDFVLKYRSDALAPKPIPVDRLLKNKLYLNDFGYESKMVNDAIWLGNSEMLNYLCELYERFPYFYQNAVQLGHKFAIEKIVFQHLIGKYPFNKLGEFGLMNAKWKMYGRTGVN